MTVVGAVLLAGCVAGGAAAISSSRSSIPSPTQPPLPTLDAEAVARGREMYLQTCASCHGANAEGGPNWQQPDARGNLPPPPHDDNCHTWRHADAQLDEIIRNGMRDPFNTTPELTMPGFNDRLSDQEIADVIAYFKSLWSDEHRRFQQEQNERPPTAMPGRSR